MASLGELEIDVVQRDKVIYQNTVTDKPVEDKADISDHIKIKPNAINLVCLFAGNEAEDKHSQLVEMRNQEEVFTYEGALGTYENMAIVEISPTKEARYGNGFECDVSLKQIRTVQLQTAEVSLGTDPGTDNQVQGESEGSEQRDSESEEKDEDTIDSTTLQNITNIIGDYFGGEE